MKISEVKQEYQLQQWSGMLRERQTTRFPVGYGAGAAGRVSSSQFTKGQGQDERLTTSLTFCELPPEK